MTLLTALEIFTNPLDLMIVVGKEKESGKFGLGIYRGPGHNYKPMITSVPFAETLEKVVEEVKKLLEVSISASKNDLESPRSPIANILNPSLASTDQMHGLDQIMIDEILWELQQNQKAYTWEMFEGADVSDEELEPA